MTGDRAVRDTMTTRGANGTDFAMKSISFDFDEANGVSMVAHSLAVWCLGRQQCT